jgi:hypothetical protein
MATNDGKDPPPQRRNWVSPLAPDAVRVGHAAFVRAGFADPTLVVHWAEIAGAETARLARPLRLSQSANGGVLTLLAEPGAAVFLQHDTRALCERINTYLGRPAVARLKFVQGSLSQPLKPQARAKVPDTVAASDPALHYKGPDGVREALWRLARARRSQS